MHRNVLRPQRTVVKTYGRDSILGLLNPFLALMARAFGLQFRLKSEGQVAIEMKRDAVTMLRRATGSRPARNTRSRRLVRSGTR